MKSLVGFLRHYKDLILMKFAECLLGAKKVDGAVRYLLRYKDGFPVREITPAEAKEKWPQLLLEFLEHQVEMNVSEQSRNVSFTPIEALAPLGEPMKIDCECAIFFILMFYYQSM